MNRPASSLTLALIATLTLTVVACGDDGASDGDGASANNASTSTNAGTTGTNSGTTSTNSGTTTPNNNTVACEGSGTRWAPGTAIFREVTDAWFPDASWGTGTLFNVADIDGDGWADLLVRYGGTYAEDFSAENGQRTWLLRNTGEGAFEDITQTSGIRQTRRRYDGDPGRPGDVFAFADVDNDGDLDIYSGMNTSDTSNEVVASMNETSELLLNNGDGTFSLTSQTNGIRARAGIDVPSGAAFVDYDRDGLLDIWISQSVPAGAGSPLQDRLFRGDGSGGFTEVTEEVGTTSFDWDLDTLNAGQAHTFAWSANACDLNNDGTPDLIVGSYGRGPNHLWQGERASDGAVTYTNRGVDSNVAFDHRQDWSDNESARCYCTINPDAPDCAGVPEPDLIRCSSEDDAFRWRHSSDREPFRLGGNTGAIVCGDVNNDGNIDLLTTEIVHWDVGSSSDPSELLFNTGQDDIAFERPGNEATGLTREYDRIDWNDGDITASLIDFDNDGWQDVYIGSTDYPGARGLLYHQTAPGQFVPVPLPDGIDHTRSHGIAVADFDRDGDLDLIVGHSRNRCGGSDDCYDTRRLRMFENVLGDQGRWVQLKLEGGPNANRSAVGARVTVTAGGVTQTQEVNGGYGHYGAQNDMVLHFGLGDACEATVTVRWPDADLTTETFTVTGGKRYRVVQGADPVEQAP